MKPLAFSMRATAFRRRGVTLLLTMLVLVLAVTVLSREMLETTILQMSSTSSSFGTESQWIAEGVADQWQEQSRDPKMSVDDLLRPVSWGLSSSGIPVEVEVHPSSSQNKLYLPKMDEVDWTVFWQGEQSSVILASDPDRKLLESGDTALEVILGTGHISAQDAYVGSETNGVVPADVMTVWGDGRLDLNRCPREVLQARLKTFTDAQISGILRIRASGPIKNLAQINNELDLSDDQGQLLGDVATYTPSSLELVIKIRRGGLSALYFAVLALGKDGQVLEVRPIL